MNSRKFLLTLALSSAVINASGHNEDTLDSTVSGSAHVLQQQPASNDAEDILADTIGLRAAANNGSSVSSIGGTSVVPQLMLADTFLPVMSPGANVLGDGEDPFLTGEFGNHNTTTSAANVGAHTQHQSNDDDRREEEGGMGAPEASNFVGGSDSSDDDANSAASNAGTVIGGGAANAGNTTVAMTDVKD
jgi:hypothetical protein